MLPGLAGSAAALPNKEATTVAKAFYQHWIMRFGAPTVVLSDSGGEFTPIEDNTLAHLEEEFSCRHVYSADYSSKSNVVERVHQQLGRVLRIFVQKCGRAWSECLPEAAFAYNSTDLSMAPACGNC